MEDKTVQYGAQVTISAALAALSAYFGVLVIPLIMLTVAMIIDYGTGMAVAWKKSDLSSKKGVSGIIKKVGYLVLVSVGMIVDWLIFCGLENFDAGDSYKFSFGMLVAIWLIINELISILENLGAIGVPVPEFLIKVIRRLRITTEKTAETAEKENEKESEEKKDEKGN